MPVIYAYDMNEINIKDSPHNHQLFFDLHKYAKVSQEYYEHIMYIRYMNTRYAQIIVLPPFGSNTP